MTQFPRILLPLSVRRRLETYIGECDIEISGVGEVEVVGGDIRVVDIFCLPQQCHGALTEIDSVALGRFVEQWVDEGKDLGRLRLWWHSHVWGRTYWSEHQDVPHIEEYHRNQWWLSIVGNKSGSLRARLDIFQPIRATLDWLPVETEIPDDPQERAGIRAEIAAKVSEIVIPQPSLIEGIAGGIDRIATGIVGDVFGPHKGNGDGGL